MILHVISETLLYYFFMENKETNSEETPQNSTGKLWNRNFTLIWQGQFISLLGSQAFLISLMFWIKDATQSATVLGLVMMAASTPPLIPESMYACSLGFGRIIIGTSLSSVARRGSQS